MCIKRSKTHSYGSMSISPLDISSRFFWIPYQYPGCESRLTGIYYTRGIRDGPTSAPVLIQRRADVSGLTFSQCRLLDKWRNRKRHIWAVRDRSTIRTEYIDGVTSHAGQRLTCDVAGIDPEQWSGSRRQSGRKTSWYMFVIVWIQPIYSTAELFVAISVYEYRHFIKWIIWLKPGRGSNPRSSTFQADLTTVPGLPPLSYFKIIR